MVALAGRRVDPPDAEVERFPLGRVPAVYERLRDRWRSAPPAAIVAAAACGADLIGLTTAAEMGIRARIVLPFPPARFRETSVVDRPGDWGDAFDRVVERATRTDDLVVLDGERQGSAAYAATNLLILEEAAALAARLGCTAEAMIIWDGRSRGEGDQTAGFAQAARERGLPVTEMPTVETA